MKNSLRSNNTKIMVVVLSEDLPKLFMDMDKDLQLFRMIPEIYLKSWNSWAVLEPHTHAILWMSTVEFFMISNKLRGDAVDQIIAGFSTMLPTREEILCSSLSSISSVG